MWAFSASSFCLYVVFVGKGASSSVSDSTALAVSLSCWSSALLSIPTRSLWSCVVEQACSFIASASANAAAVVSLPSALLAFSWLLGLPQAHHLVVPAAVVRASVDPHPPVLFCSTCSHVGE